MLNLRDYINDSPWLYIWTRVCIDECGIRAIGAASTTTAAGIPVVTECATGYLEADIIQCIDIGTHSLFIAHITNSTVLNTDIPMTYEYYHRVIKGKAPKTAPTYVAETPTKTSEVSTMKKYECNVCGYVYNPAEGDEKGGIKPGTSFEQLPESWVCPVCGVDKTQFTEVA